MKSPFSFIDRLSLAAKVWLVIAFVIAGLATLTVVSAFDSRRLQMEARVRALRDQVSTAMAVAQGFQDRAKAGEFSEKEAKHRAFDVIRSMRWGNGGSGYVFVFDSKLVMQVHAFLPEKQGKDVSDDKDPNGKPIWRVMAQTDREHGSGVTEYVWPMPPDKKIEPKISYSAWFKPWDLHMGTGAYFVDINEQFRHALLVSLLEAALVGLLVIGVVWQSMRSIRRSIGGEPAFALAMAARIADGDLATGNRDADFAPGSMLHALQRMQNKLVEIVREVQQGSQVVSTAAQQISRGNDDLSHRTQ